MAEAPSKRKINNALSRLQGLEGAVNVRRNVHDTVIATRSPSFNFIFGHGYGLPEGYSMLLYGPPRGGKSVICNEMIGWLHQSDPEAVAVKFNTEFRESAQVDDAMCKMYGIDPARLISYEVNQPDQIFDRIEKEIAAECQDGLKVKLVIIDSLNGMQGRRGMNADSIMTQQIGDNALTIQEGLKRILPVQRKYNMGLILTSHIRAQMDVAEQMRGNKVRPAVSYGTQHHCEYYVYVEPDRTKDGKVALDGSAFEDASLTDLKGKSERTGHKITAKMMDSSLGPKGRSGQFTFDYTHGIINTHEEVFLLGVSRGVIEHPTNVTYTYKGLDYRGKEAMWTAIKNDPQLYQNILQDLRIKELNGTIKDDVPLTAPSE